MILLLFTGIYSASAQAPDCEAVTVTAGSLTIAIDPRIELLSIIQFLTDYKGFNDMPVLTHFDFPYKQEIAAVFGNYAQHPAANRFQEMSRKGFWYSHPPKSMLYLSNPPELKQNLQFDELVILTAGGRDNLTAYIKAVRSFARETNFVKFYNQHRGMYKTIVAQYRKEMKRDYVKDLEDYYGSKQQSYTIILVPLFHPGGFGPRIQRGEGIFDAYYIGGPRQIIDNMPHFGNDDNIRYLCWHEFSHSFVNHLTDRNIDGFRTSGMILLGLTSKEKVESPGGDFDIQISDWVSEHIVRGVTSRLAYINPGKEKGDEMVQFEIGQGFPYVKEITECLADYDSHRDKYPTLASFYPEIIAVFERLARQNQ